MTELKRTRLRVLLVLAGTAILVACGQEPGPADLTRTLMPRRSPGAPPVTWYVRPDGGSAEQCTGRANAPYPGEGTGRNCAWDHPFQALPPAGTPRLHGGDTLIIEPGSYRMGYGAPGAEACSEDNPWDCHMPPIPGGPGPDQPTRVLGSGWDSGCAEPPELWGSERADYLLNLAGSSNVEIACLEVTDHSPCIEDHTGGLACERDSFPYGEWAAVGLYAEDSANVRLANLNIHGLAHGGVLAGRLSEWSVENVSLAGNGWVGWDGDIEGSDANSGTLLFRRFIVEWNGCGETFPGDQPTGCWGQSAGGYGDGLGTGETGGHWIFEDSAFLNNTSDGLDLLYARLEGSAVTISSTIAQGNAGDQIKTSGPAHLENVIAVASCGHFEGQPYTHHVDFCRAGGSAVALTLRTGNRAAVINSTLTGQGDCLLIAECQEGHDCDGSESVLLRNDVFLGHAEFGGGGDTTCLAWHDMDEDPFDFEYSLISGVKSELEACPPFSLCDVDPGLVSTDLATFDAHLTAGSPAIDAGTTVRATDEDFEGRPRDDQPDIGAFEWGG